ncbi:MAG: hypothetical protein RL376_1534 [Verrucomicrobiota bacterium]|jgi:REP element-mobilizing transposase RayT
MSFMAALPERRTGNLRLGRASLPGACYFVTACVQGREPVLTGEVQERRLRSALHELSAAGDWHLLAGVVMPDHLHVLFKLGDRLTLDRVVAKLKARARDPKAVWRWQANVFEHRLCADDDREDYAFYIFMNPYRAGLVDVGASWPGWLRDADWRWRFEDALSAAGAPPPEWLGRVEELEERIKFGE